MIASERDANVRFDYVLHSSFTAANDEFANATRPIAQMTAVGESR